MCSDFFSFVTDLISIIKFRKSRNKKLMRASVHVISIFASGEPGRSVGIATELRAGTFRGSNSGGGRDFSHLSRPALGPTQPPVQWVSGLSWG